ncbi:hypothetical protein ABEF95_016847 [Exophiala dermatitidis]
MSSSPPRLEKVGDTAQLIVNGEPFLMRAAELQNSSLTSAEFMRTVWPKLTAANINTALGCVTWEHIEPEEGKFDFGELDQIIADAHANGVHLVLLWFGSFKNGLSTYVPAWVKQNHQRFPRAKLRVAGGKLETGDVLSIFHSEAPKADAKAFTALMKHLSQVDRHSTVLMVQVENEIGLLGDSRDGSDAANERFAAPVPQKLVDTLNNDWESLHPTLQANLQAFKSLQAKPGLSWEETFGASKQTDELFMAYHYALYVEQVASAGKSAYPLPLYTNVWQNYVSETADNPFPNVAGGGGEPGDYPSGGGVVNVIDIWQSFAPSLDLIAPDIYLNDYAASCAFYRHRNQPLFIPEQRRDDYGARRIWLAYGTFGALAASPFGIDTLDPVTNPYRRHYELLAQVQHHVLQAQRRPGSIVGFFFDELSGPKDPSPPVRKRFGDWDLLIERSFVFGKPSPGYGMVIHLDNDRFLLIGQGFQVTFASAKPTATFTGILSFLEKEVVNVKTGQLKTLRELNGDETRSGKFCIMPSDDPDYGDFPICVTIPANTRIAEARPYCLEE